MGLWVRGLFLGILLAAFANAADPCAAFLHQPVVDKNGVRIAGVLEWQHGKLWLFPRYAEAILVNDGTRYIEGVFLEPNQIRLNFVEVAGR